jgi:hypothetical protein
MFNITNNHGPWDLVWNSPPSSLAQLRKLERILEKRKGGVEVSNYY